jgi:hypothetical protein
MKVNIHNRCSDLKLVCGRYFSNGACWNEDPDEEIDAGSMKSMHLTPFLSTFEGVLTYDLKRKGVEPIYIRLLVAWKSEGYKKFRVQVHLIEYDKTFRWDIFNLNEYCQRYANQLGTYAGPIKDTWLIHDGKALMTRSELNFTQRDGVLNITIVSGVEYDAKRPIQIDTER